MQKILYVIPGFGQTTQSKGFPQIIKHARSKGYTVVPINITWKYKSMSDYVEEFKSQLKHKSTDHISILGFSFGAMIALIAAQEIKTKNLYLCSLSPYFKEDLLHIRDWWKKFMGKRRIYDFEQLSFKKIIQGLSSDVYILAGEKEGPEIYKRVNEAHKKIKKSKLIVVENTKHDISQRSYIEALKNII